MSLDEFLKEWNNPSKTLLVHTSGSTGEPKPLLVEKRRMEASARITCQFLGIRPGCTALLCLPLDYIAGKMMVVRALTNNLKLVCVEPCGHPLSPELTTATPRIDFAAMVPMQVWNSLQVPSERKRLTAIGDLIIGGGEINDTLEAELKSFPNAVWSTYGMTETLSHIAMRRLNGEKASSWYVPFEGVHVSLSSQGCLIIEAPLVCPETLVTNDLAELKTLTSDDGRSKVCFRILGRCDNVISSGGVKIQAEEVERLLRPHIEGQFCITRSKDTRLGEAVVLLTQSDDIETINKICKQVLPRYWRPQHIVSVESIPHTATGKIARKEAEIIVRDNLNTAESNS